MYTYCSPYCFIYINSTFVTLALLFKELFLTHFYGFNNGTKSLVFELYKVLLYCLAMDGNTKNVITMFINNLNM